LLSISPPHSSELQTDVGRFRQLRVHKILFEFTRR
jgi:hypothetical protein